MDRPPNDEFGMNAFPRNPGWFIRENPPPGFRTPQAVLPSHLLDQGDGLRLLPLGARPGSGI